MTREQALDEPITWLKLMLEVHAQERATNTLFAIQAILAGTAPGALKDGSKVFDRIRKDLERQAGL